MARSNRAWLLGALLVAAAACRPAENRPVAIHGMQFDPPALTARVGDVIVWTNDDIVPHTVTAESKEFDSGQLAPHEIFRFKTKRTGTFPYGCTLHPAMKGTLTVVAR